MTIKGLYLLAVPNQAVVFDPDKEQIAKKEAKAKQLALIEEAKIRELAGWIIHQCIILGSLTLTCAILLICSGFP